MQKPLLIKQTEDTPEVVLDSVNNVFCISGKSLPEDAYEFYKPVVKWVETYLTQPNLKTELHVKLQYFNSSSVKKVSDIFILLQDLQKAGKEVKIIWFYEEGDELMEIKGQEFKSILTLPFELQLH